MVAYSFNPRFVAPILSGSKRQTIRAPRKRHALAGEALQLYTGMGTKQCRLIARATCLHIESIRITVAETIGLGGVGYPDRGIAVLPDELDAFAVADGFADWRDMVVFWRTTHPETRNFNGVHITWRDITTGEQSA